VRALSVERAVPVGDHDGGHRVADQVRERARGRHEPVDADEQREAGHRDGGNHRQRRRERDEAAAGDRRRALRRQEEHAEDLRNLIQTVSQAEAEHRSRADERLRRAS